VTHDGPVIDDGVSEAPHVEDGPPVRQEFARVGRRLRLPSAREGVPGACRSADARWKRSSDGANY